MSWVILIKSTDNRIVVGSILEVAKTDSKYWYLKHWLYPNYWKVRRADAELYTIPTIVTYKGKSYTFVQYLEDCEETPNSHCQTTGVRCQIKNTDGTINVYTSQLT